MDGWISRQEARERRHRPWTGGDEMDRGGAIGGGGGASSRVGRRAAGGGGGREGEEDERGAGTRAMEEEPAAPFLAFFLSVVD